jgi:hypothetical protein
MPASRAEAIAIYAVAAFFPGHSRASVNSTSPDPRQAGTAAHSQNSRPVDA